MNVIERLQELVNYFDNLTDEQALTLDDDFARYLKKNNPEEYFRITERLKKEDVEGFKGSSGYDRECANYRYIADNFTITFKEKSYLEKSVCKMSVEFPIIAA